jgi:hypothetical protein
MSRPQSDPGPRPRVSLSDTHLWQARSSLSLWRMSPQTGPLIMSSLKVTRLTMLSIRHLRWISMPKTLKRISLIQQSEGQPSLPVFYKGNANSPKSTTEILKSAHKYGGPTLKRLVLLGSAVSILNSFEDISRAGKLYTEKDWNPVSPSATHLTVVRLIRNMSRSLLPKQ